MYSMELGITVPTKFNDGTPVPTFYFDEFEKFLEAEFKGWTKTPVSGGWVSDTGERLRDESVKYTIYGENFNEQLLDAIMNVVGAFWEQQSVMYDLKPTEAHFVSPETEPEGGKFEQDTKEGEHEFVGHLAFADFYGCKGDLNDEDSLKEALSLAIEAVDMEEVETDAITFEPQGVTAISIITQSSVTVHTWPESDNMLVDAITCGDHDPHIIIDTLKEIYKPEKVNEWKIDRGEADNEVKRLGEEQRQEPDVAPMPTRYQPEGEIKGEGVEVRECSHGHGAFATQDFEQSVTIASFKGAIVDELSDSNEEQPIRVGDQFWMRVTTPSGDSWACYLDHSDSPNAKFVVDVEAGAGDLIAVKPIKADEEILINYGQFAPKPSEKEETTPESGSDSPRSQAMKQAYMELADQVGDDMMKLGEDQGYTPVELDALVTLQTQAKEAVMRDDLDTAAQLLHQLVTLLEQKRNMG